MKHAFKISSIIFVLVLAACGKKPAQAPVTKSVDTPQTAAASGAAPVAVAAVPVVAGASKTAEFDVSNIAITSKDLGKFPYINAPERFKHDRGDTSDLGREYFAINGKLTPKDGKVFKSYIKPLDRERDKKNILLLEKSYSDGLIALGAVETNQGTPITKTELERVGQKTLLERDYAYTIDFNELDRIKTFLIRSADKEIWIQYSISSYEAEGKIAILQVEQPKSLAITTISAEGIEKDLAANGKAVLQINFDTDKATLKADGKDAVNQIKQVLQNSAALKLALNGYTDNVGDAKHNAELSNARANAVLDALVSAGIAKSRLTAAGFGDKNPISDNSTDAGKAKNRRVELIKQ
jgi:OmpA-OmpF porin, OOP family